MAPNAVFVGLDDGGRQIRNNLTGKPIQRIGGIDSFNDLRDALHQANLWPKETTTVIDTITEVEPLMEPHIFQTHRLPSGETATSMRRYGWDGPALMLEHLRLILSDLDELVRKGVNVVLLAQQSQVSIANSAGMDYLEDGPALLHNRQYSNRMQVCKWADHVLKIGFTDMQVHRDNDKAKAGKVVQSDMTRAIFTDGPLHFIAKSRPRSTDGYRIPSVISFSDPADSSLWDFLFGNAKVE
jgi:hypothetical protein